MGFDVSYGNQTMIDDGRNGYLLDYEGGWTDQQKVHQLAQGIIRLFSQESLAPFQQHSYQLAESYLDSNVGKQWQQFLRRLSND